MNHCVIQLTKSVFVSDCRVRSARGVVRAGQGVSSALLESAGHQVQASAAHRERSVTLRRTRSHNVFFDIIKNTREVKSS